MEVSTIGLDIAKQVFQLHGADKACLFLRVRRQELCWRVGLPECPQWGAATAYDYYRDRIVVIWATDSAHR